MTDAYAKFYQGKALTRREIKALELIDRIRYIMKRQAHKEQWTAKDVREGLKSYGLISDFITIQNIEDAMRAFYG